MDFGDIIACAGEVRMVPAHVVRSQVALRAAAYSKSWRSPVQKDWDHLVTQCRTGRLGPFSDAVPYRKIGAI